MTGLFKVIVFIIIMLSIAWYIHEYILESPNTGAFEYFFFYVIYILALCAAFVFFKIFLHP